MKGVQRLVLAGTLLLAGAAAGEAWAEQVTVDVSGVEPGGTVALRIRSLDDLGLGKSVTLRNPEKFLVSEGFSPDPRLQFFFPEEAFESQYMHNYNTTVRAELDLPDGAYTVKAIITQPNGRQEVVERTVHVRPFAHTRAYLNRRGFPGSVDFRGYRGGDGQGGGGGADGGDAGGR